MKRIVSVWLPMWPIERLRRHTPGAVPDDRPLALVESASRGIRITAVNACAARDGVRIGAALADARPALPSLLSRPAESTRDRAAILKLARWAGRYGPLRNIVGADGVWIDISGVAHLFGGEVRLLEDLTRKLARFGITARASLAGTFGAAYALARFGPASIAGRIVPPGAERSALASLPVDALRLDAETALLLKRLGLRRIGQLYDLPRASIERRFSSEAASKSKARENARLAGAVLLRLDQALGEREEPRNALGEPPMLSARRSWGEPVISSQVLENETAALVTDLCRALTKAELGVRRIRLSLYRADGTVAEVTAGLSSASRAPDHLIRLLSEKLGSIDAGFGIDVAVLDALGVEKLGAAQIALSHNAGTAGAEEIAALVDRLANRLGSARITCLAPHASHIPERAEMRLPALASEWEIPSLRTYGERGMPEACLRHSVRGSHLRRSLLPPLTPTLSPLAWRGSSTPRPPLLLSQPEPITVMAEVPEGPPRHFSWRRMLHRIVKTEGPERIAPEWWRALGAADESNTSADKEEDKALGPRVPRPLRNRPRDYYRLEDEMGARFWVFREGLYQNALEQGPPRWFLHGLFG